MTTTSTAKTTTIVCASTPGKSTNLAVAATIKDVMNEAQKKKPRIQLRGPVPTIQRFVKHCQMQAWLENMRKQGKVSDARTALKNRIVGLPDAPA